MCVHSIREMSSTKGISNGQLANGMRTSYISQTAFNNDLFTYTTTQSPTTFITTGSLAVNADATAGNCPAGRVLRDNGKRLYPSAHPGVTTYMVGVFDPISFLSGFIDPNSPVFAVYNGNKPASLDTTQLAKGVNPNGGGADLAPTVYTSGNIETTTGNVLATTGSVLAGATLGFTTGAGGTVTQGTNKSTGVTLNKSCGVITMNNASLNGATAVSFTVTNSTVTATDYVMTQIIGGGTFYNYRVNAVAGAGSFVVTVYNSTGGALGDALQIQFAVIQAVNA